MNASQLRTAGGRANWDAAELGARGGWSVRPSAAALAELSDFARAAARDDVMLRSIRLQDGMLPRLRAELEPFGDELRSGSGVILIRGLPLEQLARAELDVLCWAIGCLFGDGVAQNLRGELLGDVINLSDQQASARPFQNGGGLIMHRDPVDVVGLLCVRHAKHGGLSRIVSAPRIHDILLHESPERLARLYEGFPYHRLDEDRGDSEPFTPHKVPVFARDSEGNVGCFFIPGPINRAGRLRYPIDPLGRQALDDFVALSERSDLYFDMDLKPGDLQLLNNRVILHGRTDYEDSPELQSRRLMLRLWLQEPRWPALHPHQRFFEDPDHFGNRSTAPVDRS
ncbi:MAG: TauD/TfdA family dioxygenase [Lautropia sp.]